MILTGNANDWMHALLSLLSCVPLSLIGQASTKNVQKLPISTTMQPWPWAKSPNKPMYMDALLSPRSSKEPMPFVWAPYAQERLSQIFAAHRSYEKGDCPALIGRTVCLWRCRQRVVPQRMADLVADAVAKKLRSMDVDWTFVSWNVYRCRDLNFHCSAKSSWLSFTDCVWTVLPDKHRGEAMRKKKFEHCGMSCASSRMLQTIGKLQFCFQPVLSLYLFPSFFSG